MDKLNIKVPDCINDPIKEGLTPISKSIGSSVSNTFSTAWELVFGGLDTKLEKVRIKRQQSIEIFKNEINTKINEIPKEKLIEGKLHTIGPILDASKFYTEEDTLRNMFSNLLASSVNSDLVHSVHPSFIEIIKQLSPEDAQFLSTLIPGGDYPTANFSMLLTENSIENFAQDVFIFNKSIDSITLDYCNTTATYINNISRLGLVTIKYTEWISSFDYDIFESTPCFKELETKIKNMYHTSNNSKFQSAKPYIEKGHLYLTTLGNNFLKTCINI